jgi:hypothetical protein
MVLTGGIGFIRIQHGDIAVEGWIPSNGDKHCISSTCSQRAGGRLLDNHLQFMMPRCHTARRMKMKMKKYYL